MMWSTLTKALLIELTVPWEGVAEAAYERKKAKYSELAAKCRKLQKATRELAEEAEKSSFWLRLRRKESEVTPDPKAGCWEMSQSLFHHPEMSRGERRETVKGSPLLITMQLTRGHRWRCGRPRTPPCLHTPLEGLWMKSAMYRSG
ncbi:unnamed protein product [Lota lota]